MVYYGCDVMVEKVGRMAHDCRRDELSKTNKNFIPGDVLQCSCGEYWEVVTYKKVQPITKFQLQRMVNRGLINLDSKRYS